MDVILTDAGAPSGSITYRTTGGILDLLFFAGPSPLDVTRDVSASLGYPALPPYWGLGFHLCRWGYKDINETAAVVAAMRAAKLPHDVMWNDIDYMSEYLDFTSDSQRYPMHQMRALVDDLHAHGQHYVMITDPGISSTQPHGTYPPLDEGIAGDVFINVSGKPLVGKVWPGETACALPYSSHHVLARLQAAFLFFCRIAISNVQTSLTLSQMSQFLSRSCALPGFFQAQHAQVVAEPNSVVSR
jgi:lysosomal alpha-glucosidase